MNKGLRRASIFVFLSLMVVASFVVGCGTGAPQGAEIRIGIMGGLTGPAPGPVTALVDEAEHIFSYINEVEGGIEGAKVSWRVVDNRGTPEGAITAYKELRDSFNPLLYFAVEDYYLLGVKDTVTEDKSVIFTASAINPQSFVPPGGLFSISIPTSDGFAGYVRWVLDNWKGSGQPKIGVLYWGDLPTGQQWRMAEGWVRKQGVELVPVTYSIATLDLKPQLMNLRDAGVDHIWMMGISENAALAIRDFLGLGLGGQIPFCFSEYVEAEPLLGLVGPAAEGFYVYRSESPYSDNTQSAKLYSDIWKWATGEDRWSDNRLLISLKAAITAAIKQAVADVGWDNLDQAAVYSAMDKLNVIDTWGNQEGLSFGPTRRVGVSTMKISQFTKDGTVAISDWIQLPRTFEGVDK